MSVEREKARARGTAGEWLAAAWLTAKGYRILTRQFRALGGELDIVALTPPWSPRTIVFVEVRARGTVEISGRAEAPAGRGGIGAVLCPQTEAQGLSAPL
jgi:putative endonuclease